MWKTHMQHLQVSPADNGSEVFDHLKFLPDPVPGQEGHYKPFIEVHGMETTK